MGGVVAKWLALSAVLCGLTALAFGLAGIPAETDASSTLAPFVLVAALEAAVLVLLVSSLSGSARGAALATFVVYFGAKSFMSQIESAFFVTGMPKGDVLRVSVAGLLLAAAAAPFAVWLLRRERSVRVHAFGPGLPEGAHAWIARLAVIVGLYLLLYFTFGYYVVWLRPEAREFYGGGDPEGFFAHMFALVSDQPGLLAFQILRALLWTAIALPVLTRFAGGATRAGLAIGLAFSVFMSAQLVLPNVYMPFPVRMAHLVEVGLSNAIFGFALVWILSSRIPTRSDVRTVRA